MVWRLSDMAAIYGLAARSGITLMLGGEMQGEGDVSPSAGPAQPSVHQLWASGSLRSQLACFTPAANAFRFSSRSLGGIRSSRVLSQTARGISRWAARAPSRITLATR